MQHFKEFFVCPHCGKPVISKEYFLSPLPSMCVGACSGCGGSLIEAHEEAIEDAQSEQRPRGCALCGGITLLCPECGRSREVHSNYCGNCGAELRKAPAFVAYHENMRERD